MVSFNKILPTLSAAVLFTSILSSEASETSLFGIHCLRPTASIPSSAIHLFPPRGGAADDGNDASKDTESMMKEYLEKSGMDTSDLDSMMEQLQGLGSNPFAGGGDGGPPDIEESLKSMQDMMNSPLFQGYMSDPEKLEQSRQMMLNNPMMKGMMGSMMPGFDDILNDADKWRETMQAAAEMYKNLGSDDLMKMMGAAGAGGIPGMGGGDGSSLADMMGGDDSGTLAGLDDLSEGED